jgi:hypothetical protein
MELFCHPPAGEARKLLLRLREFIPADGWFHCFRQQNLSSTTLIVMAEIRGECFHKNMDLRWCCVFAAKFGVAADANSFLPAFSPGVLTQHLAVRN